LLSFTVTPVPDAVRIEWETAWEVRTYGFYLYRGQSDRWDDATQIAFVPAAGRGQGGGAQYVYNDLGVDAERTYSYWLVVVDLDGPGGDGSGQQAVHGPATVITLPDMPYHIYISLVGLPSETGVTAGGTGH
jgi:hypothetical protein